MRVAYLTSMYPDVSHTFILREVRALRRCGVDVETFSVRRPRASNILGDQAKEEALRTRWLVPPPPAELLQALAWGILTRPLRMLETLAFALKCGGWNPRRSFKWTCYGFEGVLLARRLVKGDCQHLHCHFGNAGASTGLLAARIAKVPYSVTMHGSELSEVEHHRLPDKVAAAAFVACVSEFGRNRLRQACPPEHWDKLHIVRCGVEAENNPRVPPPNLKVKTLLCVGRLSPEKGHRILLEALQRMRQSGKAFRCTLVGDGPERDAIEQRITDLNLTSLVLLTGSLPPAELDPLYAQADVVVLSSFSEGVPVVLMEAMARRIPVVATNVGGASELVQDHQTGLLVAPGDPDALAHALTDVIENPIAAQSRADKGWTLVQKEFNPAMSAQRMQTLFTESQHQSQRTKIMAFHDASRC